MTIKDKPSKETLQKLYNEKTDKEISEIYNCTTRTIQLLRHKYGIKPLTSTDRRKLQNEEDISTITDEQLIEECSSLTNNEIAKKYKCSLASVKREIADRVLKVERKKVKREGVSALLPKKLLQKLYMEKTDKEIGKLYEVSDVVISRLRKKYEIKTNNFKQRRITQNPIEKNPILGQKEIINKFKKREVKSSSNKISLPQKKQTSKNKTEVDRDNCLASLKILINLGHPTNRPYYQKNKDLLPEPAHRIEKAFKGWNNFLKEAGVKLNNEINSPAQKMLDYRNACLKYNKFLTFYELEKLEGIPATRYKRMFNAGKTYSHLKGELYLVMAEEEIFNKWLKVNFKS